MKENQAKQTVTINDRETAVISGVEEVLCYDENNVVIKTSLGQLALDGAGLNVVQLSLDEGIVSVRGRIDAFYYMEQKGKGSLFSRIFK